MMDASRRTSTLKQIEILVEFVDVHRDLALGRLRSKEGRALSARLWSECANNLNAEGPARLPKEWAKVWNDMKSRVRSKLTSLALSQRGTGGGPYTNATLTPIEERVADVIGRDIGPLRNVAVNPFALDSTQARENMVEVEQHVSNEVVFEDYLHQHSPEVSPEVLNEVIVQESPTQSSPDEPYHISPSSTPRRRRSQVRQSPRPRLHRATRVRNPAQSNRAALDETCAVVSRLQELRARTECMLAEASLRQAEAAKSTAEAALQVAETDRLRAQTMSAICNSVASLVPAIRRYLERTETREE